MRKSAVYAKDVFKIALVGACMKHVNHCTLPKILFVNS